MRNPKTKLSSSLSPEQFGKVYSALVDEFSREQGRKDEETWARISQDMGPSLEQSGVAKLRHSEASWRSQRNYFAAAFVAAVACGALWSTSGLPLFDVGKAGLSFEVEGDATTREVGSEGARLVLSKSAPVELKFSDRSVVVLQPQATLRVSIGEDDRVSARLAQGKLKVDVEHGEKTDYRFLAGPYEVQVVGTAFALGFEPQGSRMDLVMTEGKVVVVAPEGRLHVVHAGEELHLGGKRETSSNTNDSTLANAESSPADLKTTLDHSPLSNDHEKVVTRGGERAASVLSAGELQALARAGKFDEIVSIARKFGVERALSERSAVELQEIAQAARYTGDFALAGQVWTRMSSRFSGTITGRNAVFFLGRLAEQRGRYGQAIGFYSEYLSVNGGSYAAEAFGRKLQLVRSHNGIEAARPVAREYLQRFPTGAYAKTAQELSGQE